MQSAIWTTYHYVGGGGIGPRVNVIDEHTGFIEGATAIGLCLGDLLAGVYHGFTGQWAAIANDAKALYERIAKGADKLATARSNTTQQKGGQVAKIGVVFRAWSEDDIKGGAFGNASPTTGVTKIADRKWVAGDVHHYMCVFDLDLTSAPPGEYVFAFGACDNGWWSDIAVASTFSVYLNPQRDRPIALAPDPSREQIKALEDEFTHRLQGHERTAPKHTGERPQRIVLPTVYEVANIEPPD